MSKELLASVQKWCQKTCWIKNRKSIKAQIFCLHVRHNCSKLWCKMFSCLHNCSHSKTNFTLHENTLVYYIFSFSSQEKQITNSLSGMLTIHGHSNSDLDRRSKSHAHFIDKPSDDNISRTILCLSYRAKIKRYILWLGGLSYQLWWRHFRSGEIDAVWT